LGTSLRWALEIVRDRGAHFAMRRNAMAQRHSWERAAERYLDLYASLGVVPVARRPSRPPPSPIDEEITGPTSRSSES
ncbi:MAG: hypothetical protein ACHREM_20720, partial [Polyangiales bacterium]